MKSRPWPVRGLLLDPARLIERHEYYLELLDDMARWGLNTLWWHFTDDQGFMLKLRGHPELATPHAFTIAEMKDFLSAARRRGIDVAPELESLGHARCITALPQYAGLHNGDELGFNAICPSHPRTLPLLEELIVEVAGIFDSPYFHAGLDEVKLGDCPRCARAAAGRPRWWVYAQHLKAVHSIVRSLGKELIVWADHVEHDPEMLDALPRDLILAHWHYTQVPVEHIQRSLRAGFRVIGCPALCHWGDVIMTNAANYENMDAMAEHVARLSGQFGDRVLGIVNTNWANWRGLRDAYRPAMAYTGAMLAAQGPVDKLTFLRQYAKGQFGLGAPAVAEAIWTLHQAMPVRQELAAALFDSPADMVEALALAARPEYAARGQKLPAAVETLAAAAAKARKNRPALEAIVLAGRVAELCCRRPAQLASALEAYRLAEHRRDYGHAAEGVLPALKQAASTLRLMDRELADVTGRAIAEWGRTRYKNDAKKGLGGAWRASGDALLVRLDQGRRFGSALAKRFAADVAAYRKTGRLPLTAE